MKALSGVLLLLAIFLPFAYGDEPYTQDFISDGSVTIEGYFDDTQATIFAAELDKLTPVKKISLSRDEKLVLDLPDRRYLAESNRLLRITAADEPQKQGPPVPVIRAVGTADISVAATPTGPQVFAAPWRGTQPHEIYNGKRARLKAVAKAGSASLTEYKWDLSDGYSTGWLALSNAYVIELDHTFPTDGIQAGAPWTGTITVKDASGFTAQARYDIVVRPDNLDTRRNIAIDDALWYLHKCQIRSGSGETGTGYWRASNSLNQYYMAATGMAVTAFENSGHLPGGDPSDPYVETVERGLNYIMATMQRHTFGESDKWFDMNGNGYGLRTNSSRTFYEGGVVLLAIAGSQAPDRVVPESIGIAEVRGHTYKEIAQEMSDYFGGGQYDYNANRGGWRYSYNEAPDMSAVQWPVLGMHAAEENLGIDVHETVKTRLREGWLVFDQNSNGGFGYTSNTNDVNVTKTAAGISCFWWVGTTQEDTKAQAAINFITSHWGTYNVGNFYPMYAVMKSARLAVPEISTFGTHDWYTEYSTWLTGYQSNDGHWDDYDGWISPYLGPQMRTAMGVLIMTTAVITQPPVAQFTALPNPADIDIEITFDASESYDPNGRPLTYSWDFGDGTTAQGQVVTHTYSERQPFTVVLTVANNAVPPQQGIATQTIYVTPPNHPPTSIPGGPYTGWIGPVTKPAVRLDGSQSYDINAPLDSITMYEWELDGVFPYDFDEGNTPITDYVWQSPGKYDIALRVTDDPNAGFTDSGKSTVAWTTVEISLDATAPAASATVEPQSADGANDWYYTAPTITISAEDAESGLKEIRYWWDDQQAQTTTDPSIAIVAAEGSHVLHYYAIDAVDNASVEQTLQIKVDSGTPSITLQIAGGNGPYATDWYHSAVDYRVLFDAGISGAAPQWNIDNAGWSDCTNQQVATVTTDGSHTVNAKIVTNSGKEATAELSFKIDTTPPVTALTTDPAEPNGNDGWFTQVPSITLTASDATDGVGIAEIHYCWAGQPEAVATGNAVTFDGLDHTATLHYYAVNTDGNPGEEASTELKVDTALPSVTASFDAQSNGSNGWYLTTPTITLNAADPGSGVSVIRYHWDADAEQDFAGTQLQLQPAQGEHTLYYQAIDVAGNASAQESLTCKGDTSPIETSIEAAGTLAGDTWYSGTVTLTFTAVAGVSGADVLQYKLDYGNWTTFTSPGTVEVSAEGQHQARIKLVTVSGRTSESELSFIIDNGPPVTQVIVSEPDGQDGWYLDQPMVLLSATDTGSGVKGFHFRWNDESESTTTGPGVLVTPPFGENVLHFYAMDNVGQAEEEHQLTFKCDPTRPTLALDITGNAAGTDWFSGTVTATVTVNGDGVEIASTEIRINGGNWFAYDQPVTLEGEGAYAIEARTATVRGKTASAVKWFTIDNGPPVTTYTVRPISPNGTDGWYIIWAPKIKLAATDTGVGVREIHYSWNDQAETVSAGASLEFEPPAGENILHFYAVDNLGQAEPPQQQTIKYNDGGPDLVVESVTVAQATAVLGQSIDVTWTIRNNGSIPTTTGWTDLLTLEGTASSCGQVMVGVKPAGAALAPGESYTSSASVTIPNQACLGAGDYTIGVTADFTSAQFEDDEDNNFGASNSFALSVPPMPDLQVLQITLPPEGFAGQSFNLTWSVTNVEDEIATGPWTDRIWLSTDDQIGDDQPLGSYEFPGWLGKDQAYQHTKQFALPEQPGTYWIVVKTDAGNAVNEHTGELNNAIISDTPILVSGYSATVQTDTDVAPTGTPVELYGSALSAGGSSIADVPVTVRILNAGVRRVLNTRTDTAGNYRVTFQPLPTEAGHYQVAAAPPFVTEDVVQDEFALIGMKAKPATVQVEVPVGTEVQGSVEIKNLTDIPLTGLTAAAAGAATNLQFEPTIEPQLPGSGKLNLNYRVLALDGSELRSLVTVTVASAEGAETVIRFYVQVKPLVPDLTANPPNLSGGMLRGTSTLINVDVTNNGGASTGPLNVLIPVTSWISLVTPATIDDLAPGEKTTVILNLTPPADLTLGPYNGTVVLSGASCSLSVPFQFNAISEGKGSLRLTAVDEYTYYAEGSPKLAGASVTLRDPATGNVIASGLTDGNGEIIFEDLTEAYYALEVSADKHGSFSTTTLIPAGEQKEITAFLPREFVSYHWSVVPTQIEDKYKITVESVFETNVPAPVVTIEPSVIDLDDYPDTHNQVNVTITNHGLIAAEALKLSFGSHPWFSIQPLTEDLGSLPAISSVVVPVMITRLNNDTADGIRVAEDAPCGFSGGLDWKHLCGGEDRNHRESISVLNANHDCTRPWSTGGGSSGSGGGWGGGSGAPGSSGNPYVTGPSFEFFNPCDECSMAWMQCFASLLLELPGLDVAACIYNIITGANSSINDCITNYTDASTCLGTASRGLLSSAIACGGKTVGKPIAILWDLTMCAESIIKACSSNAAGDPRANCVIAALRAQGMDFDIQLLQIQIDRLRAIAGPLLTIFGDPIWLSGKADEGDLFTGWLQAFLDATTEESADGMLISESERLTLLATPYPTQLTEEHVTAFIERWNRSVNYWSTGVLASTDVPGDQSTDFIALDEMRAKYSAASEAIAANKVDGFEGLYDGLYNAEQQMQKEAEEGVCARVRIQIQQEAVITRSAFLATLELQNNSQSIRLENIRIDLDIRDEQNQPANDLFGIRQPELTNLTAVDGTGVIEAATTGKAQWTLIPTRDAAPDYPTEYLVGGEVVYTFGGTELRIPLFQETITVLPSPVLKLKYFHERDVYSDDPFTDEIEPPVPFSLGLLLTNDGHGAAHNVRITSAQPQIIENEKGLLIDFKIIGTQVGNQQLTPSLEANFGDIAPGETAAARWLMTASLMGKFVEYSATFEHVDDLGDPRLSLIDSVEIHELMKVVRVDQPQDDDLPDFFVNDVADENDLPETIHSSDGSVIPVQAVLEGTIDNAPRPGALQVHLAADMPAGWAYLRIDDPGMDDYQLAQVMRADGTLVPVENFWTTHRTHRPLGKPEYREHLLHLLDYNGSDSYILSYEPAPTSTDVTAPQSSVEPLPAITETSQFEVRWNGTDEPGGSGLLYYQVYVSVNGEAYVPWLLRTTKNGGIYTGYAGNSYSFYSIAVDTAGNAEAAPAGPDATTTIPSKEPLPISIQLSATSDSGAVGDGITNDATPTVKGTTGAQANVVVTFSNAAGWSYSATAQADANGNWLLTVPGTDSLPDGSVTASASASNANGQVTEEPAELTLVIDTAPPVGTVLPLEPKSAPYFKVRWSVTDADGSGILNSDIYVSEDGGEFTLWKAATTDDHDWYTGELNNTYAFCCWPRDLAGNVAAQPAEPDTSTLIVKTWPRPGDAHMDGRVNIIDLLAIRHWLFTTTVDDTNWYADVNEDGKIDIIDLIFVRNRLGRVVE